jgi:carbon monoxide dehydrogenase subunit G
MDINGEFDIPVSRQQVWEALNDPQVLAQCIPGCESIERESDTEMLAKMLAKIGPVKARFESRIRLSNINPPQSYTISGEGKGGPAGFGKGSADVTLAETGGNTILRYTATLQVGGKLAQIGSRLVGGAARKIANDFFGKFVEVVADPIGSD